MPGFVDRLMSTWDSMEEWYGRRLDKAPIGATRIVPTGRGLIWQSQRKVLEARGWQKVQTTHVTGVGYSSTNVTYRKVR